MSTSPQPHSQFTVSSGSLCYGALHNIWYGATQPVQGHRTDVDARVGESICTQSINYNVAARNGTWTTYKLLDRKLGLTGWFICHSEVSPESEINRILRVSGSPYEEDSGSVHNDANTISEGILVLDRGDWGFHDSRAREDVPDIDYEGWDPYSLIWNAAAGLVDTSHAQEYVRRWQNVTSSQRYNEPANDGIWLDLATEYMFGRFGFDNEHTAAQSFLFFSGDTMFSRTKLEGATNTLRFDGTTEERFLRRLQDGRDFSGIERLRKLNTPYPDGSHHWTRSKIEPPPEEERLGPFEADEYILTVEDIHAILSGLDPVLTDAADPGSLVTVSGRFVSRQLRFAEPWKLHTYELLNDLVLTYLQICVLPFRSCKTMSEASSAMFSDPAVTAQDGTGGKLSSDFLPSFSRPRQDEVRGIDMAACSDRIKSFLNARAEDIPARLDEEPIMGLARVLTDMVVDWLEMAAQFPPCRGYILPESIRGAIYGSDVDLQVARYSAFFWEGRASIRDVEEPRVGLAAERIPLRFQRYINLVVFSYDTTLVGSAANDKTIRIWRVDTGECIKTVEVNLDWESSVAFSPNLELAAIVTSDNIIRIWSTITGKYRKSQTLNNQSVTFVSFSQDSKLVAAVVDNDMIWVYRSDTGQHIQTFQGHSDFINSKVFSHNAKLVASASNDQTIRIWHVEVDYSSPHLDAQGDSVNSVVFSSNLELVASTSNDGTIQL